MSQEGGESDRSEQPTPFKLDQARKKGTVARGMDLGFAVGIAAFLIYAWAAGDRFRGDLAMGMARALAAAPQALDSPDAILAVTGAVMSAAARPVVYLAATLFVCVLVFELVQTGVVFTATPLAIDFNRLNPAQGLKRLFSVRLLIETVKGILKLLVYGAIAFVVIRQAVQAAFPEITDAAGLSHALVRMSLRLLALFLAVAVVFAAADQIISRRDFLKRMRMSRREVRRETRDREGEPRMKQRRQQLHREFAKLSESLRNVRGADVMITNPTHYAVALKFDPRTMDAPMVVARGAHAVAQRLKRLAFLYGVVVVPNPPLARALCRCELNTPVPEALYRPVADIYRALRDRKADVEVASDA